MQITKLPEGYMFTDGNRIFFQKDGQIYTWSAAWPESLTVMESLCMESTLLRTVGYNNLNRKLSAMFEPFDLVKKPSKVKLTGKVGDWAVEITANPWKVNTLGLVRNYVHVTKSSSDQLEFPVEFTNLVLQRMFNGSVICPEYTHEHGLFTCSIALNGFVYSIINDTVSYASINSYVPIEKLLITVDESQKFIEQLPSFFRAKLNQLVTTQIKSNSVLLTHKDHVAKVINEATEASKEA